MSDLALCADYEVGRQVYISDTGVGVHGDWCREGVEDGEGVSGALADWCAQLNGLHDAGRSRLDVDMVEQVFPRLFIQKGHLKVMLLTSTK